MADSPEQLGAEELQSRGLPLETGPVFLISRAYGFAEGVEFEEEELAKLGPAPVVERRGLLSVRNTGPQGFGWWTIDVFVRELLRFKEEMLSEKQPDTWPTRSATECALRAEPFRDWKWGDPARWTCGFRNCVSAVLGCYQGHPVHEWIVAHPSVRAAWEQSCA